MTYNDEKRVARIYIDGVKAADGILTIGLGSVGETENVIGADASSASSQGSLSVAFNDLAFYSMELTHEQIIRDYNFFFKCRHLRNGPSD